MKPPATVPKYEHGHMGLGIHGGALFFPKVRVLKNGLRKRVGKALTINEPFEVFLNVAMRLAERAGVKIRASVHYPKPRKAKKRKARK